MSTISQKVLEIIHDAVPFDEDNTETYYIVTDQVHSKIMELLPQKTAINPDTIIRPNFPLWLWHKGSKTPELVNFRTDYPSPLFWPIVDGDYINSSNSISFDRATHFMYVNDPED